MAANPQVVNTDLSIVYDGVTSRLQRGAVIDMPSGSALANATTYVPPGTTSNSAALSTRVTAMSAQQCTPGSSDSVNIANLAVLRGGGNDPYNAGENG